jgi:hypothetical protein
VQVRNVRGILGTTFAIALAVFCIVQDRVTAEGARRYVALQRLALAGRGPAVSIDEVLRPAVDRSVRLALLSSGAVVAAGAAAAFVAGRSGSRRNRSAAGD